MMRDKTSEPIIREMPDEQLMEEVSGGAFFAGQCSWCGHFAPSLLVREILRLREELRRAKQQAAQEMLGYQPLRREARIKPPPKRP